MTFLIVYSTHEDMVDHDSYTHNLSSCEIKAWKIHIIHLHSSPSTGILRTYNVTSSQMAW